MLIHATPLPLPVPSLNAVTSDKILGMLGMMEWNGGWNEMEIEMKCQFP